VIKGSVLPLQFLKLEALPLPTVAGGKEQDGKGVKPETHLSEV